MIRKIEMTFECNQDWEQMEISGHGRHCELCCRTVYDFSNKSIGEVAKVSNGELCGMFLTEQIHSDLKPINFPFSTRTTLLTIGTLLGLELSQAHGQDLDKGHRIESASSQLDKTDSATTIKTSLDEFKTNGSGDCENVKRPVRSNYYFSKRFPFIVKRKIRTVGRYRI